MDLSWSTEILPTAACGVVVSGAREEMPRSAAGTDVSRF